MRGPNWSSNVSCCLFTAFCWASSWVGFLPHPRIASCRGDDFSVALGSSTAALFDLQSFWHPSAFSDLHRRPNCYLRNRNRLVVAHGPE
jgi:hypothetical protein